MTTRYGSLFQIADFAAPTAAQRLGRVHLGGGKAGGGYDEAWLQRLIASHPQALPIGEIEAYLEDAVPICLELATKAGPIDLLLVTPRGDIVVVECKLWRNPQARREVVGQIIDYAKELPRLTYEAFEAAIRKAEPAGGAERSQSLFHRASAHAEHIGEADFIDSVSRNLRRGRFLLLIVGDGIQEGVEQIADFLQQHAGMHFTLALVEVAIFHAPGGGFLVQPRVVARTQMIQRGVVAFDDGHLMLRPQAGPDAAKPGSGKAAAPVSISEERLFESLEAKLPSSATQLRQMVAALDDRGAAPRFTAAYVILQGHAAGRTLTLAKIGAADASVWLEDVVAQATAAGRRDLGLAYYQALAALVRDPATRSKKQDPTGSSGTAGLPLGDLLAQPAAWLAACDAYLRAMSDAFAVPA